MALLYALCQFSATFIYFYRGSCIGAKCRCMSREITYLSFLSIRLFCVLTHLAGICAVNDQLSELHHHTIQMQNFFRQY